MTEDWPCALWVILSCLSYVGAVSRDVHSDPAVQLQNAEFSKAFAKVQNFFALIGEEEPQELMKSETKDRKKEKKMDSWPSIEWADSDFIIVDPFEDDERGSAVVQVPLVSSTSHEDPEAEKRPSKDDSPAIIPNEDHKVETQRTANVDSRTSGENTDKVESLTDTTVPCLKQVASQLTSNKSSAAANDGELKQSGTQDSLSLPDEENITEDDPQSENQEEEPDEDEEDEQDLPEEDDASSEEQQEDASDDSPESQTEDNGVEADKDAQITEEDPEASALEKAELSDGEDFTKKLRSPYTARFELQEKIQLRVKEAQDEGEREGEGEEEGEGKGEEGTDDAGEAADLTKNQETQNTDDEDDNSDDEKSSNKLRQALGGPKVTEDIDDTDDDSPQGPIVPTVFGINRNYQRLGVRAPYVPVAIGEESGTHLLLYKLVKIPNEVRETNQELPKRVATKTIPRSMRMIGIKVAQNPVSETAPAPCESLHKELEEGETKPVHRGRSPRDVENISWNDADDSGDQSLDHHDTADKGEDQSEDAESRHEEKKGKTEAHHDEGEHASGHREAKSSGGEHEDHAHAEKADADGHGHHTHSDGHEKTDNDSADKGEDLSEHSKSKHDEEGAKKEAHHDEGENSAGKHKHESRGSGHEDLGYDDHKKKKNAKGFRDKYHYDKTRKHDSFYSNHKKKGAWNTFDHADSYSFDDDDNDEKGKHKKAESKNSGKGNRDFWQDFFSDEDEDEWEGSKGHDRKYGGKDAYEDKGGTEKKRRYKHNPGFYSWG